MKSTLSMRGAVYIAPRNVVLLLVFSTLLGFWLLGDGGGSIQRRDVQPLLANYRADEVMRVLLERPDAAAVATLGVERTTLTRAAANSRDWQVKELFGASALRERVDRLLARLGSMTTLERVTEDAARHADYGLTEDKALRVRMFNQGQASETDLEDSEASVDLLLAPAPERAVWVRLMGEDSVWRVPRYSPPSAAPRSWFDDSSLMSVQDNAISAVKVSGEAIGEPYRFALIMGGAGRYRDDDGNDLSGPAVLDILDRMRTLFPTAVVGAKEPGAALDDQVWLRVEVTMLVGGKSFVIEIAEPAEGSEVRAAKLDGRTVVTLARRTVEKLAETLLKLRDSAEKR